MKRMVLRARLSTLAFALCCLTGAYAETGSVLSATGGRFVYGQVSAFGRDQFMLDTQDGRLWRIVCIVEEGASADAKCKYHRLDPIYYNTDDGLMLTPDKAMSPPPKSR